MSKVGETVPRCTKSFFATCEGLQRGSAILTRTVWELSVLDPLQEKAGMEDHIVEHRI